MFVDIIKMFIY